MGAERIIRAYDIIENGPLTLEAAQAGPKDPAESLAERVQACRTLAEAITDPKLSIVPEFSKYLAVVMAALLRGCNDFESDVRMVADESLNKVINGLIGTHQGRLQFELYKEIKKPKPAVRSLRVALVKFADLCILTKPLKCRAFVNSLMNPLRNICEKSDDESLQQTLGPVMEKLCRTFGLYFSSQNIVALLEIGLINLSHSSATVRRTASATIGSVCQYARAPEAFIPHLLVDLLQMAPNENEDTNVLLGVFSCLSQVLDVILSRPGTHILDFGKKVSTDEDPSAHSNFCGFMKTFLNFLKHTNTNVLTSALDVMLRLLKAYTNRLHELFNVEGTSTLDSDLLPIEKFVTAILEFLLPKEKTKKTRVSVKALAMACFGQVVEELPELFFTKLMVEDQAVEGMDLLAYETDEDPVIRGGISLIAGQVLNAIANCSDLKNLSLEQLTEIRSKLCNIIVNGLGDESSTIQKLSSQGAGFCIESLFLFNNSLGLVLLKTILNTLANNCYWLVQIELLGALEKVNFTLVAALEGKSGSVNLRANFQELALSTVVNCLDNSESKVRVKASECLVAIAPSLFFWSDLSKDLDPVAYLAIRQNKKSLCFDKEPYDFVTKNVSRIIEALIKKLFGEKNFKIPEADEVPCTFKGRINSINGVYQALQALIDKFGQSLDRTIDLNTGGVFKRFFGYAPDIVSFSLDIVTTVNVCTDLSLHPYILSVVTNLCRETPSLQHFPQGQRLLDHLLCILHVCTSLITNLSIEDAMNDLTGQTGRMNPVTGRYDKDASTSSGESRDNSVYRELFTQLSRTYNSGLLTLNFETPDTFTHFVRSILHSVSLFVTQAGVKIRPYCDELIKYLNILFPLAPHKIVTCVKNMVQALFSTQSEDTNTTFQFDIPKIQDHYSEVFIDPKILFTDTSSDLNSYNYMHDKRSKLVRVGSGDKVNNQRLLRLFESLVMDFKHKFCVTSDVDFQKDVLGLLVLLISLRVNYSLLDHDGNFISFLFKQFELIACGYVRRGAELLNFSMQLLACLLGENYNINDTINVKTVNAMLKRLADSSLTAHSYSQSLYFSTSAVAGLSAAAVTCFSLTYESHSGQKDLHPSQEEVIYLLLMFLDYHEVVSTLTHILRNAFNATHAWWSLLSRKVFSGLMITLKAGTLTLSEKSPGAHIQSLYTLIDSFNPNDIELSSVVEALQRLDSPAVRHGRNCTLSLLLLQRLLFMAGCKDSDDMRSCGYLSLNLLDSICSTVGISSATSSDISLLHHIFFSIRHLSDSDVNFRDGFAENITPDNLSILNSICSIWPCTVFSSVPLFCMAGLEPNLITSCSIPNNSPYRRVWLRNILITYSQQFATSSSLKISNLKDIFTSEDLVYEILALYCDPLFKNVITNSESLCQIYPDILVTLLAFLKSENSKKLIVKTIHSLKLVCKLITSPFEKIEVLIEKLTSSPILAVRKECEHLAIKVIKQVVVDNNENKISKDEFKKVFDFVIANYEKTPFKLKMLHQFIVEKVKSEVEIIAKPNFPDHPNLFDESKYLALVVDLACKNFLLPKSTSILSGLLKNISAQKILQILKTDGFQVGYLHVFINGILSSKDVSVEKILELQNLIMKFIESDQKLTHSFAVVKGLVALVSHKTFSKFLKDGNASKFENQVWWDQVCAVTSKSLSMIRVQFHKISNAAIIDVLSLVSYIFLRYTNAELWSYAIDVIYEVFLEKFECVSVFEDIVCEIDDDIPMHGIRTRKLCYLLNEMSEHVEEWHRASQLLLNVFRETVIRLSQINFEQIFAHFKCMLRSKSKHKAPCMIYGGEITFLEDHEINDPITVAACIKLSNLIGCPNSTIFKKLWDNYLNGFQVPITETDHVLSVSLLIRGVVGLLHDRMAGHQLELNYHRKATDETEHKMDTSFPSLTSVRQELDNTFSSMGSNLISLEDFLGKTRKSVFSQEKQNNFLELNDLSDNSRSSSPRFFKKDEHDAMVAPEHTGALNSELKQSVDTDSDDGQEEIQSEEKSKTPIFDADANISEKLDDLKIDGEVGNSSLEINSGDTLPVGLVAEERLVSMEKNVSVCSLTLINQDVENIPSIKKIEEKIDVNRPKMSKIDYQECAVELLDFFKTYMYDVPKSEQSPMLLTDMTKAVLTLMDITPSIQLFKWIMESFTHLYRMYSDALNFMPYLIPGLCKAATFLNVGPLQNDSVDTNFIVGILEHNLNLSLADLQINHENKNLPPTGVQAKENQNFQSQYMSVSAQIAVLQGVSCLLNSRYTRTLVLPLLGPFHKYLSGLFKFVDPDHSPRLYLACISVIASFIDKFPDETEAAGFTNEFIAKFIEVSCHKKTPDVIYHCVLRCLDNLLIQSPTGDKSNIYLSLVGLTKRLDLSTAQRSLSALALTLTSMFAVKDDKQSDASKEEKLGQMLDRISRGLQIESELYTRLLPTLLCTFFSTQQIMSSVMGEFLSCTAHSGPYLSSILFTVVQMLKKDDFAKTPKESNIKVVCDWIVLSLNSFVQKNPSLAKICLSSLFISVSKKTWIVALHSYTKHYFLYPHLFPENIFFITALDFFENQGLDDTNLEVLLTVFEHSEGKVFADIVKKCRESMK